MNLRRPLILSFSLLLATCQVPTEESVVPDSGQELADQSGSEPAGQSELELEAWEAEFRRQRIIGDLLYDALIAVEEDRLLTPVDDNAHGRYQRVLAIDPGNKLAQEGLQNIVNRYLELAAEASRQGRFPSAHVLLDRARFVDWDNPAIRQAQAALDAEMQSGDLVFELDGRALAMRAESLRAQLVELASQAREHDALVWITAPDDESGRWMFVVMRESVNGYRLRGNIEIGPYAIVRLRKPEANEPGAISVTAEQSSPASPG